MRSLRRVSFATAARIVRARLAADAAAAASARSAIDAPSEPTTFELLSWTINGMPRCFMRSSVRTDEDKPAAVQHHEVYRLGTDLLGGGAEKALAVGAFIVDEDEKVAGANFRQYLFDRGNGHK
jgi:hypothetical protein